MLKNSYVFIGVSMVSGFQPISVLVYAVLFILYPKVLIPSSFFPRYFILDYLICDGCFPEMYQGVEFDPLAR